MGRMRSVAALAVFAAGFALVAGPAFAFDINGTWAGKISCKGIFDGEPQTLTLLPTLLIDDTGELQLAVDGVHYAGLAFPDPAHPDKGQLAIVRCGTSSTRSSDAFGGEFGRLKVSTKPSKGTGSLSGATYRASVLLATSVYTCKWSFKRMTTDHPTLAGCSTPQPN